MNEAFKNGGKGRREIKVPIMLIGISNFEIPRNGEYRDVSVNGLFFLYFTFINVCLMRQKSLFKFLDWCLNTLIFLLLFCIPGKLSKLQWVKEIKIPAREKWLSFLFYHQNMKCKSELNFNIACTPVKHRASYSYFLNFCFFIFKIEILVVSTYIPKKSITYKIIINRKIKLPQNVKLILFFLWLYITVRVVWVLR